MAGSEQGTAALLANQHEAKASRARTATRAKMLGSGYGSVLLLCVCENMQMVRREILPVLLGAGYDVDLVEASTRRPLPLLGKPYRLLLFDVGSKSDNQYQICSQTRLATGLPILLMLRGAARNEIVRGFQAGADAYVLVPFDPRELLARVDALLRRVPALPPDE